MAKLLLEEGADPTPGEPPERVARCKNHTDCVKVLQVRVIRARGARIAVQGGLGRRP